MEDREKVEEQVEDLETPAEEAEEVKGGFHWGVSQTGVQDSEAGPKSASPQIGPRNRGGWDGNHNEILLRL